jgi:hypothetical protein
MKQIKNKHLLLMLIALSSFLSGRCQSLAAYIPFYITGTISGQPEGSKVHICITDGNGEHWPGSPIDTIGNKYGITLPSGRPTRPIIITAQTSNGSIYTCIDTTLAAPKGQAQVEDIMFEKPPVEPQHTQQPFVDIAIMTPADTATTQAYTGALIIGAKTIPGTLTNGRFRFTDLLPGTYYFQCRLKGSLARDINGLAMQITDLAIEVGKANSYGTTFTVTK